MENAMNEMIHSLEEFLSLFPFSERDSLILRNFNTYLTNRNKLNSNIPYGLLIQCSDSELANTFLHHLDAYIETAFSRRYSLVHMTESSLAFYDIRKRINSNQLLVLTDFQDSGDIDQLYQAFTATPDIVKIVIASEDVIKSRFYSNDDFFYRLLPRHITLSAGGPKEICNQFILSFGQSYRLSNAFKSELFYYIETIYPQADFQGNAFVEDLKNRITRQLLEIPDYQKYISDEEMGAEFVPYSTKVLDRKKAEHAADILEKPAPVPVFPEFTPLQMESKERATAVILFFLSEYRPAVQAVYTSPDGKEYYGIQTVDAPIQYLIDCAARDGATNFMCLCITSHKVYTSKYGDSDYSTFERTEKLISDYTGGHASVQMLRYDFYEKDQPISDLNEISNYMFEQLQEALKSHHNAHSYIEYTGGLRDISFLMTSIVRYLEFSGISFKKIVFSNFQTKHLYDLDYIYNIYQIINGTSEFLEYGNSRQLQKLFEESTSGSDLLKAIQEFSNAISICSVDEIDSSLKKVVHEITKFKNEGNDITASMLQYLIPTIQEKLCIDQMTYDAADGKQAVNYPVLIQWCVDHNLIQQAVTLYIEKMPVFYFTRNLISPELVSSYTPTLNSTKEHDDFYTGVYDTIFHKCDSSIKDFAEVIGNYISDKTNSLSLAECKRDLLNLKKQNPRFESAFQELLRVINNVYYLRRNMTIYDKPVDQTSVYAFLCSVRKKSDSKSSHLAHYFVINDKLDYTRYIQPCGIALDPANKDRSQTYLKKLEAVRVLRNKLIPFSVMSQKDQERMEKILLYFLAMKLLRNNMNHASERELSSYEQAAIQLINEDFLSDVKVERNVEAIYGLLKQALDFHRNLEPIAYPSGSGTTSIPSTEDADTQL